jgi:hypothetical protein
VIRELRDSDIAGLARVWRDLRPDAVHTAEHGVVRVITDNDEQNASDAGDHRRLGYEPFVERLGFVRSSSDLGR